MRCSEFEKFNPGWVGFYETMSGIGKVLCEQEWLNENLLSSEEVPIEILDQQVKKEIVRKYFHKNVDEW